MAKAQAAALTVATTHGRLAIKAPAAAAALVVLMVSTANYRGAMEVAKVAITAAVAAALAQIQVQTIPTHISNEVVRVECA